jgi:hypothetical protein
MKNISRLKQWHRLIALLALCLSLTAGNSKPAFASVHTYPESPTQVMYRSLQTLRDETDKAWQTVLYKRLKSSQVDSVHLRLVGFPGTTELAGTAPLRIATGLKNNRPVELLVPPNAFARVAESFPTASNSTQPTAISISPPLPWRSTLREAAGASKASWRFKNPITTPASAAAQTT